MLRIPCWDAQFETRSLQNGDLGLLVVVGQCPTHGPLDYCVRQIVPLIPANSGASRALSGMLTSFIVRSRASDASFGLARIQSPNETHFL